MHDIEIHLDRLKTATGAENETALAQFLGISQAAISGAKKKGRIPYSWFFEIADRTGVSSDWLFFGRSGHETSNSTDMKQSVSNHIGMLPSAKKRSEQAVLGSLMLRPCIRAFLIENVDTEDFLFNENKKIYMTIKFLFLQNAHIDLVTVAETLSAAGKLEEIGGAAYIAECADISE